MLPISKATAMKNEIVGQERKIEHLRKNKRMIEAKG